MFSKFYGLSNFIIRKNIRSHFSALNCSLTTHGQGEQHPIKKICRFSLMTQETFPGSASSILSEYSFLDIQFFLIALYSLHCLFRIRPRMQFQFLFIESLVSVSFNPSAVAHISIFRQSSPNLGPQNPRNSPTIQVPAY